jgi:hypothetical protein
MPTITGFLFPPFPVWRSLPMAWGPRSSSTPSRTTSPEPALSRYPVIRFDDDSMLFLKGSGTGTVDGARTNFIGTVAVIGGRKRFEAVRGDGKLTGTRSTV